MRTGSGLGSIARSRRADTRSLAGNIKPFWVTPSQGLEVGDLVFPNRGTSGDLLRVAIGQDRHKRLVRAGLSACGHPELLLARLVAIILKRQVPGAGHHLAGIDRAPGIDGQEHHLASEQGVAGPELAGIQLPAWAEPPLERNLRIAARRALAAGSGTGRRRFVAGFRP